MSGTNEYSWRQLLEARSADLHSIADMRTARRFGGIFWLLAALVIVILLPLTPPDESSVGGAGWFIAGCIVLAAVLYGLRLLRSATATATATAGVRPREILIVEYVGVALIAVLALLGGEDPPYEELLLLPVIYTAAVFSPRATGVFLVGVAAALAVVYFSGDGTTASEQVARLVIWGTLAMATSMLFAKQRLERAALLERGEEAEIQARADPLTGLGNRRAFDEALEAASGRAARTERSLSVIIADVEAFKTINDVYGLDAGDRLLQEVAAALDEAVRAPDACFRWGGDEFVVLADIDGGAAASLGQRLGHEIRQRCARPDGQPVHLHVGVAELDPGADDPEAILGAASRAMKPAPRSRG